MVLAVHSSQIVFRPGFYADIFSKGAYGVQLFFIVSSLTLFLSYEQRRGIDTKNTVSFFFIRRFFRVAPAFYLAIILYVIAFFIKNSILLGSYGSIDWKQLLTFISFLGVLYPQSMYILPFGGWTVQIEMFFYMFIPYLFKVISSLTRAIIFFIFTCLTYITLDHFFAKDYSEYLIFPAQIPVFAIGIILFQLLKQNTITIKKPYLFLTFLCLFLLTIPSITNVFVFLPEPLLFSLFFGGLTLLMSKHRIAILQNKVTTFFGKISYSFYLLHFIIILFFWYIYKATSHFWNIKPEISFLIIYLVTLGIGTMTSWLSYAYIEKRGINFGKKILSNLSNKD